MTQRASQLILIPHSTAANTPMRQEFDLSAHLEPYLTTLQGVFVESLAGGRQWLKSMKLTLPMAVYNLDTPDRQLQADLESATGQVWAFVSDAGYPCVADPGARLVEGARRLGFEVRLLPGTSSIMAAIALSGLNAQRFTFHSYLPREADKLASALVQLEKGSRAKPQQKGSSTLQLFIETPYRHQSLLRQCLESLDDTTLLCVATELCNKGERVRTMNIRKWKEQVKWEEEGDQVAVYLLLSLQTQEDSSKSQGSGEGIQAHGSRSGVCSRSQKPQSKTTNHTKKQSQSGGSWKPRRP